MMLCGLGGDGLSTSGLCILGKFLISSHLEREMDEQRCDAELRMDQEPISRTTDGSKEWAPALEHG